MADNVFIKRASKAAPSYAGLPLLHLVGVTPKSGEIGIEIEVEGNKFPKGSGYQNNPGDEKLIPKQWKYDKDGSLRGEDNAEYVLAKPILFTEVEKAVKDLWQMFDKYGTVLSESNRTSVHVHLNVQDFHLNRLCSFVSMYFVVEELLTSWCGDHRVGNLFCLRGRDAPAIIRRLKEFFQRDGYGYEFSSGMHYAGLNPSALHKFGSIEIRALRGVNDPQVILDWVSVLERLYTLSAEFKDPREVVAGFSGNGPIAWLQNILGDKFSMIMNNVPYTTDGVRDILYNGIRLAQDLCYCRDWSQFKEQKVEHDPFRRKTAAVSLSEYTTHYVSPGISPGSSGTSGLNPSPPLVVNANGTYSTLMLVEKVHQIYESGHISSATRSHLLDQNAPYIQYWLIASGYLPATQAGNQVQEEPEEHDEPELDDYWNEDEDED